MDLLTADPVGVLGTSLHDLQEVVASLDDSQMGTVTNCEPWTVRQLASHALNNQLFWAGIVTGNALVSIEDTMGAVPIDGDLVPVASDVAAQSLALWQTDGVLAQVHATPAGGAAGARAHTFAAD